MPDQDVPRCGQTFPSMLEAEKFVRAYTYSQGFAIIGNGTGSSTSKTLKCHNPDIWFSEAKPCHYGFGLQADSETGIATITGMTLYHEKDCIESQIRSEAIKRIKKASTPDEWPTPAPAKLPKRPVPSGPDAAEPFDDPEDVLAIGRTFATLGIAQETIKAAVRLQGFSVLPAPASQKRAPLQCKNRRKPELRRKDALECKWKVVLVWAGDDGMASGHWEISEDQYNPLHNAACTALCTGAKPAPSLNDQHSEGDVANASGSGSDVPLCKVGDSRLANQEQVTTPSDRLKVAQSGSGVKRRSAASTKRPIAKKTRIETTSEPQSVVKNKYEEVDSDWGFLYIGSKPAPQPVAVQSAQQGSFSAGVPAQKRSTFLDLPDVVAEALAKDGILSMETLRACNIQLDDIEDIVKVLEEHHGISKILLAIARKRLVTAVGQL